MGNGLGARGCGRELGCSGEIWGKWGVDKCVDKLGISGKGVGEG